jgi:MFS family permease
MPAPIAALLALLAGTGLLLLGNGLLGTLVALRMLAAGFSPGATGLVTAAYFAGFMAGALYADRAIRRVGHIRAFAALASALAACALGHAILSASPLWGLLRAVAGFCMAGLFMTIESWLNAASSNEVRGAVLSTYMIVLYAALGSSQLLLGLWPPGSVELLCLVAMSVSLASIPVSLTRTPGPNLASPNPLSLRALLDSAPAGVTAALGAGILTGEIYGAAPIYAHLLELSRAQISVFMSALIFGGLLLQWPLGRLSDRTDRRRVIFGVAVAVALTSAGLLARPEGGGPGLYALAALFGSLVFSLYPLSLAHVFDRMDDSRTLRASSLLLLCSALGSIAGPLLAAGAMDGLGPSAFFATSAVVAVCVAAVTRVRIHTQEPVAEAERSTFLPVPRTTAALGALDPRTPDGPAPA